jgi:DNA-binding IclR family transcriptional regulator
MNIDFITKILELFSKDLSLELTILQISKQAGLSYNAAHRTVQALIGKGVLNHKKIGGSIVVSLNKIPLTFGYLALVEASHSKTLKELAKKVGEYEKDFS